MLSALPKERNKIMANQQEETAVAQVVETAQEGSLLDKIITDGRMGRDDFQKERAKDMIGEFVSQVMSGELTMSKNMDVAINSRIAEIDRLISSQMNEIMHHEDFQKLEGSWRGLHHLLKNSITGTQLKIKIMSVTKKTCLRIRTRAGIRPSNLFKKIYEEEYGTYGGAPFGA